MWAFFSARLRMWLIFAIVAPAAAWLLGKVGDAIEARRGPNGVSSALQWLRGWLGRRARGPWAGRGQRPAAAAGGPADPGAPAR
ncbi:MAG: hypothetical protein ACT4RN_18030 [Pseudonocardia sp.]